MSSHPLEEEGDDQKVDGSFHASTASSDREHVVVSDGVDDFAEDSAGRIDEKGIVDSRNESPPAILISSLTPMTLPFGSPPPAASEGESFAEGADFNDPRSFHSFSREKRSIHDEIESDRDMVHRHLWDAISHDDVYCQGESSSQHVAGGAYTTPLTFREGVYAGFRDKLKESAIAIAHDQFKRSDNDGIGLHLPLEERLRMRKYGESSPRVRYEGRTGPFAQSRMRGRALVEGFKRYNIFSWGWLFLILLGCLSGFFGFMMDVLIRLMYEIHLYFMNLAKFGFGRFVLWSLIPPFGTLFSILFVRLVAPTAAGSGIPEMKAILGGVHIVRFLSIRTFIAKVVGLTTALGSGLSIGKEGPFVHASSIIAHQLSRIPVFSGMSEKENNSLHLQLLASGCAVGVSSNFGAPIGGVLFSIEVTSTYYPVRNYWKAFFAAAFGAVTFRILASLLEEGDLHSSYSTDFDFQSFSLFELLAFVILGFVGGILGALFVRMNAAFVRFRQNPPIRVRWLRWMIQSSWVIPFFVSIVTGWLTFPGFFGTFMSMSPNYQMNDLFRKTLNADDSQEALHASDWHVWSIWGSTSLVFIYRFLFTIMTIAFPLPAGVYAPSLCVGAAGGRCFGELLALIFPSIEPGTYAVAGAAVMAAGVTRTISSAVIVFEMTGQLFHMIPVLTAVLIAVATGNLFNSNIYDSMLRLRKLPFLPDIQRSTLYTRIASSVMQTDLAVIGKDTTYREVEMLLANPRYEWQPAFPVVVSENVLIGSIDRDSLRGHYDVFAATHSLTKMRNFLNRKMRQNQERKRWRDDPFRKTLSWIRAQSPTAVATPARSPPRSPSAQTTSNPFAPEELEMEDREHEERQMTLSSSSSSFGEDALEEISPEQNPVWQTHERLLDCTLLSSEEVVRTVDPAPFQCVEFTPLLQVHFLFSMLNLSFCYVTAIGQVVGMVTRPDLIALIEGQPALGKLFSLQSDRGKETKGTVVAPESDVAPDVDSDVDLPPPPSPLSSGPIE